MDNSDYLEHHLGLVCNSLISLYLIFNSNCDDDNHYDNLGNSFNSGGSHDHTH
jgi:hypothetical protein